MSEGVKCQNCGKDLAEDEVFATGGKTLCEDCYIVVGQRIRVCDPEKPFARTATSLSDSEYGFAIPGESGPRRSSGRATA